MGLLYLVVIRANIVPNDIEDDSTKNYKHYVCNNGLPIKKRHPAVVKNWYNEFNRVDVFDPDESRAGRPKSVVVPEKINAVRELIKQDRQV
ncbi:hypothetical protein NPIL_201171 [Nephila pilipes]|uniref:Uncharacterized protein n=1 Tax=Nephila pilipes TaxID=299642 RepID=A0A8X6NG63_NEPPI|nr:hypothetical protein NPIL_201171 [Nephila pilipes]